MNGYIIIMLIKQKTTMIFSSDSSIYILGGEVC